MVTAPLAWRVTVTTADQSAPRTAMHTNIAMRGAANVKKRMRPMRNRWRRFKLPAVCLKQGLLRCALKPQRGQVIRSEQSKGGKVQMLDRMREEIPPLPSAYFHAGALAGSP